MSLPPGFLDELRNRLSLAQVVGRKVVWDMRRSNQAKGDMWAPCPFHQEKSASFHVDDRKGYYYCFGCHAKGDAVTFVKETENLGFMEAVEVLAREVGMPMPARDPKAAQVADRRSQLIEVMEEAVKWFRLQLKTSAAAEARAYLVKRGLSPAAQDRWEIGFAPEGWHALQLAMKQKGIPDDLLVASGLCARSDKGGEPYDRFRNRIIFPIRDARGRAISLGGRAMDPKDNAKYLNGPETEIFDKGRNLFNVAPAREAAGKGQPLIVAEGYMDVIALSEAGFAATVAPLGTAVTADQLQLMWRIADEPVIALDGDTAGTRAALRVIDLALPLLQAGKGLRFAMMPAGQDPDDLIRAGGAPAFQRVLDAAEPMVRLLWQRETDGKVFDSPERRAALDKVLRAALTRITDPSIRSHYADEVKRLRADLFGAGARPPRGFAPRAFTPRGAAAARAEASPLAATRASLLAAGGAPVEEQLREAVILAVLARHPHLLGEFVADLEAVEPTLPEHRSVHAALLSAAARGAPALDPGPDLEKLMALNHVRIAPPLRPGADADVARQCLAEEFAKLAARRGARREIEEAVEDFDHLPDEGVTWRLREASEAVNRAQRSAGQDRSDLGEDRAALSAYLQNLIDAEVWRKKQR